ncbi:MAG: carbohydrate ABC transporter permease, partial [Pseudomonadota bacterium]
MTTADDLTIKASSQALLSSGTAPRKRNLGQVIRWMLLFGGGILMVMPLAYMISTSLKFPFEVYNLNLVPEEPTLENYQLVLGDVRFAYWFGNSLLIAV